MPAKATILNQQVERYKNGEDLLYDGMVAIAIRTVSGLK
jgi:hypothetical protein